MSRGHDRERLVQDLLEVGVSPHGIWRSQPWWTMRSAGSLGDVDLAAAQEIAEGTKTTRLLLIEVKSDDLKYGPWNNLGPQRRADARAAAKLAGAELWLAYVPVAPRGAPKGIHGMWLPESEWPE